MHQKKPASVTKTQKACCSRDCCKRQEFVRFGIAQVQTCRVGIDIMSQVEVQTDEFRQSSSVKATGDQWTANSEHTTNAYVEFIL